MELKEKFSIAAPPDEVWPLMSDPAVVAACIPGAELNELTPEGAHRGKVTFKFGPTVAVFRGETRLTYDHAAKRCLIEARGIDQKGASRARARFEVAATGSETTDVTMEGTFDVAGPLESEHHQKSVGDSPAAGEQTVVVQHEETVVAEIGLQARLFFMIQGHALVGVIGQARQHEQRLLTDRQHPLPLRRHRNA